MKTLERLRALARDAESKILLYVIDGVGGLPHPETGKTELEVAATPNLDAFALKSATGRTQPAGVGVASGSGPGHLALFGYPNLEIDLPRGVLEVLGATKVYHNGEATEGTFELRATDLTARGNFATVNEKLIVTDRRGGYPTTEQNEALIQRLSSEIRIDGVELFFFPGKQHRFAIAMRGEGLRGARLTDTDPQQTGLEVRPPKPIGEERPRAVALIKELMSKVHDVLGTSEPNYCLLRGIGTAPDLPSLEALYRIRAGAFAVYPMYRGVARLVGMEIIATDDRAAQIEQIKRHFDDFDFFFVHIKEPDAWGHKGDFDGRVSEMEKVDEHFGALAALPFDVIAVTGDHSTPTVIGDHSHHPVPTMVWSKNCLNDEVATYTERSVATGTLGTIAARDLMAYLLAEAGRFNKFGA
ncbi:MAG: hypothetical protein KC561_02405 [Myxococcales bacterium]|nr:hypothetical protein [Myxococcales bacterium]